MTFKEKQARAEGNQELLKGYLCAQKDFLELHLAQWIRRFRDKLQTSSADPFYAALADVTERFVTADLDLIRRSSH